MNGLFKRLLWGCNIEMHVRHACESREDEEEEERTEERWKKG